MAALAAEAGCPLVLMHMLGEPKTMQRDPRYEDVVREVRDFLAARAEHAIAAGVEPENVILDPGIGFGKTLEHNLTLLRRLRFDSLVELGFPVLFGASRKRFIGTITGVQDARSASPARWRRTCSLASGARPSSGSTTCGPTGRRSLSPRRSGVVLRPDDRPRRR